MLIHLLAALANPTGAPELCDGVDNDENGLVDDGAVCTGCAQLNYEGRSYLVCTQESANRAEASGVCEAMGYHLVDVQSEDEHLAISAELSLLNTYWSGLSDSTPNTYRWSDGELAEYIPWAQLQPDDLTGTENCAWYVAESGAQVHELNDVPCSATGAIPLCESPDSPFECLPTDTGGGVQVPLPYRTPPPGHVICSCQSGSAPSGALVGLGLLLALRRRGSA